MTIADVYGACIQTLKEPPGCKFRLNRGFRPPRRGERYLATSGKAMVASTDFTEEFPRMILVDSDYEFHAPGEACR